MLKNFTNKIPSVAKAIPIPSTAAMDAFNNLVDAWKDCNNTAEIEKTKRENIKSWRDTNIKAIEENSAILKLYLEKSFQERASTIQGTFERLDQALVEGNSEVVGLMMNSIVAIVKESPLAQARQVIADMNNPNVSTIDI
ncbi:hypothetical protein HQN60_11740 [Deefgea piscis]|uniref:Uncharacterized protein n=1 Tax=Deefgea piscis TaxID=2739061 RepID=A0A6M8SQ51_9NEIS|nr:hypothetical protein [Deefgea piscis]QKJ67315.1 hypothetical protein HQN60_11740 [Deefgea piscis]